MGLQQHSYVGAETAMASALRKAGVNTNAALLRTIAEAELHKTGKNVLRSLGPFTEEIRDSGGIMSELVPYVTTRDLARAYLEGVAADMRGEGLKVPAKAGDGVLFDDVSRQDIGPVDNSEDEMSSSVHVMSQRRFGGPSSFDSVRNGAVQPVVDGHIRNGRIVPIPNKPRGLEALRTHARVNTLFDSYLTRDGIPIGDLVWSALPRIESANAREAALLRLLREHVTPGDPNARVRDLIKIEDLQRMIKKAAEIANV